VERLTLFSACGYDRRQIISRLPCTVKLAPTAPNASGPPSSFSGDSPEGLSGEMRIGELMPAAASQGGFGGGAASPYIGFPFRAELVELKQEKRQRLA
jgi:hypothetical protein